MPGCWPGFGRLSLNMGETADVARLMALARARGDLPATREDAETAGVALGVDFSEEAGVAALRDAIVARLGPAARGDPEAAFAQASEALEELTGRAPGIPAIQEIASLVALAAGLEPGEAKALRQRMVGAE